MQKLFLNLLFITCILSSGACYSNIHRTIPTRAFVKITKSIKISKCSEKTKKCVQEKAYFTASGISIKILKGKNTILTAGHICDLDVDYTKFSKEVKKVEMDIFILDYRGSLHKANTILYTLNTKNTSDLCVLESKTLDIPKVKFSKTKPKIGDDITALSSPYGIYHPPTVPIFKGVFSGDKDSTTSIVTVPSNPGSSGGPVLNLKHQVIGAIFAVHIHFPNVTLISRYETTKEFLDVVKKLMRRKEVKKSHTK
jgi:hypothetical protein